MGKIIVPERVVLAASRKLLEIRGYSVERRNVVAVEAAYKGKGRRIRAGTPGASDLWGCCPGTARHFELEVKREGERPRLDQVEWLIGWHMRKALAFWVDNLGTLHRVLDAVEGGWDIHYLLTTRIYTVKGRKVESLSGDFDLVRGRSSVSC